MLTVVCGGGEKREIRFMISCSIHVKFTLQWLLSPHLAVGDKGCEAGPLAHGSERVVSIALKSLAVCFHACKSELM